MNEKEEGVANLLRALGFTVYRNGWPDFLAVRGSEIVAVEHKNHGEKLRREQAALHAVLKRVMPVHVVYTGKVAEDGSRGLYGYQPLLSLDELREFYEDV